MPAHLPTCLPTGVTSEQEKICHKTQSKKRKSPLKVPEKKLNIEIYLYPVEIAVANIYPIGSSNKWKTRQMIFNKKSTEKWR